MKKSQPGFGFIGVICIILIMVVVCTGSWIVYKKHHDVSKSLATQTTSSSKTTFATNTSSTANPSASDIQAAHSAILAYCNNTKAAGETCDVNAGTDNTAPGFVETNGGSTINGQADSVGAYLAKDINGKWTVIWFGQDCIPQNTASQYSIPSTFNVCAS